MSCTNRKRGRENLHLFEGEWMTLHEIARHKDCEVTYQTLIKHLKKGMKMEDAVKSYARNTLTWKYKGKEMSLDELARLDECVVERDLLRKRLYEGMEVERAVTQIPRNIKRTKWDEREDREFRAPSIDAVAEGRMTKEEREYWDWWIKLPLETIIERCERYWSGKPMKEVETIG